LKILKAKKNISMVRVKFVETYVTKRKLNLARKQKVTAFIYIKNKKELMGLILFESEIARKR